MNTPMITEVCLLLLKPTLSGPLLCPWSGPMQGLESLYTSHGAYCQSDHGPIPAWAGSCQYDGWCEGNAMLTLINFLPGKHCQVCLKEHPGNLEHHRREIKPSPLSGGRVCFFGAAYSCSTWRSFNLEFVTLYRNYVFRKRQRKQI